MSETVYHVTTVDRAERCLEEGIVPYKTTMCRPETLELDRHYDSKRPPHIVARGLTRLGSVYAHTTLDRVDRLNGGWLNRNQSIGELAVLAVEIHEPAKVFVAEGLFNAHPHIPEEYWASIMSLEEYRLRERDSTPTFRAPCWHEKHYLHRPDRWKSYIYMWPEVLIPGGVKPDMVRQVPKELLPDMASVGW